LSQRRRRSAHRLRAPDGEHVGQDRDRDRAAAGRVRRRRVREGVPEGAVADLAGPVALLVDPPLYARLVSVLRSAVIRRYEACIDRRTD